MKKIALAIGAVSLLGISSTQADIVHLDDVIIDGSACVGMDCVNGEGFGFDTIRIKENNLRIRAVDTSSTSSFPTRDWQITFNDSANGGANKFSIDDIDGGRTPFTIEAGAPSNSLYVEDGGKVGFGTSNPVVDLHVKSGNTPTTRLEQDGSSGFTPQTWDVAGNEANFFIRDATNGSTLPFRIRPGAPSSAIDVAANGYVGVGTDSPASKLSIISGGATEADSQISVENTNASNSPRKLVKLTNNGNVKISFAPNSTDEWGFNITPAEFRVSKQGSGAIEMLVTDAGNMTITGTLTSGSSRDIKHDIANVDTKEVLGKVVALPISTWSYNKDPQGVKHLGPMAEDFYQAFNLGATNKGITSIDTGGVALAAIKGLNAAMEDEMMQKDAEIGALRAELTELRELVNVLATKDQLAMNR